MQARANGGGQAKVPPTKKKKDESGGGKGEEGGAHGPILQSPGPSQCNKKMKTTPAGGMESLSIAQRLHQHKDMSRVANARCVCVCACL